MPCSWHQALCVSAFILTISVCRQQEERGFWTELAERSSWLPQTCWVLACCWPLRAYCKMGVIECLLTALVNVGFSDETHLNYIEPRLVQVVSVLWGLASIFIFLYFLKLQFSFCFDEFYFENVWLERFVLCTHTHSLPTPHIVKLEMHLICGNLHANRFQQLRKTQNTS